MRIILIIGALLLGLVGLLMSVCGGAFFFRMGYEAVVNLFHRRNPPDMYAVAIVLIIPFAALVIGVTLCLVCYRYLRRSGS